MVKVMKFGLVFASLIAAVVVAAAAGTGKITFVDHDKVAKGGALVTAPDFNIQILTRTGPGQVEVHDKETDTFYVLEGEATFVTGGTMVGGKVTAPNQQRGTDIRGGEVHHLSKGDVVAIPAGIPHCSKKCSSRSSTTL